MSSINKNYPPKARKKLVKRKVHSIELSDHFDWIRDNNWQEVLNSPKQFSVGRFDPNDPNVATGMTGAPACGDVMKLQIKVGDDGIIEDAKFKTYGCGSAIASSSLLTEWVKGQTLDNVEKIKNSDIAEELALPPVKIHCSVLAEDAIKTAIADYKGKQQAMGKWQPE